MHPPILYLATWASRSPSPSRSRRCPAAARRGVGALEPAVDQCGLGVPDDRHHARQLVGYYELGWGGWWFWDPVENASFMPWLVGTALIHSLAVTEKRGLSAVGPCCSRSRVSLSLLGTFPRAFRRAHLGACLRHRPRARAVRAGLPRAGDRLFAHALRAARARVSAKARSDSGRAKRRCSATTSCW